MSFRKLLSYFQSGITQCIKLIQLKPAWGTALVAGTAIALALMVSHPVKAQLNVSGPFGGGAIPQLSFTGKVGPGHIAYALSAHQTSGAQNCGGIPNTGKQIENGWVTDLDVYRAREIGVSLNENVDAVGGYFQTSTGTFQAPIAGVYHICMAVRAETSAVDVTLRAGGTRIAAIGTDLIERLTGNSQNLEGHWSSHSVCKNVYLPQYTPVNMWMESSEANDCTYETSYRYNHLDINLLFADN